MAVVLADIGCSHARVQVPAPGTLAKENDYVDLKPGTNLRIVVPVLKSGGYKPGDLAEHTENRTITVSSGDVIGYIISNYAVKGRRDGNVRLHFVSAETTMNGRTLPEVSAPALPFELPRGTEHVRLIYLVRVSQSDHNMAIVASKGLEALNAFTNRLRQDANACQTNQQVSCSWVPAGIAVRPES
jgi:hypothetical protein